MTFGQQNTEAEAHAQLNVAFDELGINFLDTAEMYPVPTLAETQGRTDRYIGSWLRAHGGRDHVVLATKVAGRSDRITWLREGGALTKVSAGDIAYSVARSLSRLGTDYVDLLQVHWPDRYVPIFGEGAYERRLERESVPLEEQLIALDSLVKAGKVRAVGLSNETAWGIAAFDRASERLGLAWRPASIQNAFHLLNRSIWETSLDEACSPANAGVSLLAYSPLAGGALTGKYLAETSDPAWRFHLFPGYMARYRISLGREATAEYAKVASKHSLTMTQLAIGFVATRPSVASTIVGATSVAQLRENVAACCAGPLPPGCLDDINAVYRRYRDPSMLS